MGLITQISKNTPKGASLCNHSLPDLRQAGRQIGSFSQTARPTAFGVWSWGVSQEGLTRGYLPAGEKGTPLFLFQGRELYF